MTTITETASDAKAMAGAEDARRPQTAAVGSLAEDIDIRGIKRTKLGRQWLAEYVRRIWAMLDSVERDALLGASLLTTLGREVARHGRRERASAKKSGWRRS